MIDDDDDTTSVVRVDPLAGEFLNTHKILLFSPGRLRPTVTTALATLGHLYKEL